MRYVHTMHLLHDYAKFVSSIFISFATGTTDMYLSFLCFPMDFDYQAPVKDYKGQDEGIIDLYVTPCTANGKDIQDLDMIASSQADEAAEELRGKPFNFKVRNVLVLIVCCTYDNKVM